MPESRAVRRHLLTIVAVRICLLDSAAVSENLLRMRAVRTRLLGLRAVREKKPNCAQSQQIGPHSGLFQKTPSSQRPKPVNKSSLHAIPANAVRAELDDVVGGLTEVTENQRKHYMWTVRQRGIAEGTKSFRVRPRLCQRGRARKKAIEVASCVMLPHCYERM